MSIRVGAAGEYEHGNALLSRWPVVSQGHEDMSDHRFEQRGLLHVCIEVDTRVVHVIVAHLGLIPGSRTRQIEQMGYFIEREVPSDAPLIVAGDFNDWGGTLREALRRYDLVDFAHRHAPTYPSRLPLTQLDYVYARGLEPRGVHVPRGRIWGKMSDHLPLIAEFAF